MVMWLLMVRLEENYEKRVESRSENPRFCTVDETWHTSLSVILALLHSFVIGITRACDIDLELRLKILRCLQICLCREWIWTSVVNIRDHGAALTLSPDPILTHSFHAVIWQTLCSPTFCRLSTGHV